MCQTALPQFGGDGLQMAIGRCPAGGTNSARCRQCRGPGTHVSCGASDRDPSDRQHSCIRQAAASSAGVATGCAALFEADAYTVPKSD